MRDTTEAMEIFDTLTEEQQAEALAKLRGLASDTTKGAA